MLFDADALEDRFLSRLQQAVSDGYLKWAGLIGDESEANNMPKLPGVALLLRRGAFADPEGIDVTRQIGVVEWSVYASGTNLRERGVKSGRKGATGAYHAMMVAIQYSVGFLMTADPLEHSGFPIWLDSFELASIDQQAGRAMYEIGFRHQWSIVEFGFD